MFKTQNNQSTTLNEQLEMIEIDGHDLRNLVGGATELEKQSKELNPQTEIGKALLGVLEGLLKRAEQNLEA